MKKQAIISSLLAITMLLGGCTNVFKKQEENPLVVNLWHYYNGDNKTMFDTLVNNFNKTVGAEQGIIVDAYSQGDVNQLAERVLASAHDEVGADPLPHMFAAYSDNAYQLDKMGKVLSLDSYFTTEELAEYYSDFLEDGRFTEGAPLKIFPVAKSTENLFINATDFAVFSQETGAQYEEFSTWEGIAALSEKYYNWTDGKTETANDGKAMFGIDSLANFMLLSAKQLEEEIYTVENGTAKLNFQKDVARKIWDNFYVPYVKGYYSASGRFRSDDTRSGDVIAYIGSTASASYFPAQVETGKDEVTPIDCVVRPYPTYAGKEQYAVQQGAGIVVSKSEEAYEKACVVFLKWLTSYDANTKFTSSTGYLPVKNAALDDLVKAIDPATTGNQSAILASAKVCQEMFQTHRLYGAKPFENGYVLRKVLENHLSDIAKQDTEKIRSQIEAGVAPDKAREPFLTDAYFDAWYSDVGLALEKAMTAQ